MMYPIAILTAVAALTLFSAWLSYCWRGIPLALLFMPLTSAALGLCWILLARWLDDARWILVSSVAWDVFCVAVFALFPVIFLFHERMGTCFWAGLLLSVAGIVLMQWE